MCVHTARATASRETIARCLRNKNLVTFKAQREEVVMK